IQAGPEKMERFSRVPDTVQVLARFGVMLLNPEERWIRDSMNRRYDLWHPRMWRAYFDAYAREFERLFGSARFDAMVDFDGYSVYWASLFAAACRPEARRALYLHSDMYSEYHHRFPNLSAIFAVMGRYDALVSVSPAS